MKERPVTGRELEQRLKTWGFKHPSKAIEAIIEVNEENFVATAVRGTNRTIQVAHKPLIIQHARPDSSGLTGHRDFYAEGLYQGQTVRVYFIGTHEENRWKVLIEKK